MFAVQGEDINSLEELSCDADLVTCVSLFGAVNPRV